MVPSHCYHQPDVPNATLDLHFGGRFRTQDDSQTPWYGIFYDSDLDNDSSPTYGSMH